MLRKLTYPVRRWPRLSKAAIAGGAGRCRDCRQPTPTSCSAPMATRRPTSPMCRHAEVAIVPGALVQPNGKMSAMLADRVRQADGPLEGRQGRADPRLRRPPHLGLRRARHDAQGAGRGGVPPRVIFEDHAGFDTWATMVRARGIFGVRDAVVVTQGFHMPRALYLRRRRRDRRNRASPPTCTPGAIKAQERGPRGALAGQGDRRHHARHAGDGRPDDPDQRRRRPRQLGPAATAGNPAGRLARAGT